MTTTPTAQAADAATAEVSEDTEPGTQVVVYSYGVHYKWAKNMPEVITRQLRLGNQLRNRLVEITEAHDQAKKEIWSSYPQVAAAEEALAVADADAERLAELVKAERVKQRTKRLTGPVADQLKNARAAAKAARVARRDAIGDVHVEAKARLDEATAAMRADLKDTYRVFVQEGGLYHATHRDITVAHAAAAARIQKARKQNQAASLRFSRFDGTGRLYVQLQRPAGAPQRTPELLANTETGKYKNVLAIPGWVNPDEWDTLTRAEQRRRGRVVARMRVGGNHDGDDQVVELPIQIDRMLPADADVAAARLVITQRGSRRHVTLQVTAKVPAPAPVIDGPTVAVHWGWRGDGDHLRVATWASDQPLELPAIEGIRTPVLTVNPGGRSGTVLVPPSVTNRLEAAEKTRSERDMLTDALRADLCAWLNDNGPVPHPVMTDHETGEPVMLTAAVVSKWRAPGRFAVLAQHWRSELPTSADGSSLFPGDVEITERLEAWRATDKALWNSEAGIRARAVAHRRDLYKQVAAAFALTAGHIVVDNMGLADLAKQTAATTELTNEVAERFGRQRASAAPGELRERLLATAKREGVTVTVADSKNLTLTHATCGYTNTIAPHHQVKCAGCGATYDRDDNAVAHLLKQRPATH